MDLQPKTELAIKIVGFLGAQHCAVSRVIAENVGASEYQVRRVCTQMVKHGLLEVREGSRGGYAIKSQPTLHDLLSIFEPGSFSHPEFDKANPAESALYVAKCDILVAFHNIFV